MTSPISQVRAREPKSAPSDRNNLQIPHTEHGHSSQCQSIIEFNDLLDHIPLPHGINETEICLYLRMLKCFGDPSAPEYWLTLCRIAEITLICAGHYADGCEFRAAGDLLVNPRKVLIHVRGLRNPVQKNRHGKLSAQLTPYGSTQNTFRSWLQNNTMMEIRQQALLPDLIERLENSNRLAAAYLVNLKKRMNRIAQTIGFLASWGIFCANNFLEKMQQAPPETIKFVNAHKCQFGAGMFNFIGGEIRHLKSNSAYRSPLFLNHCDRGPSGSCGKVP